MSDFDAKKGTNGDAADQAADSKNTLDVRRKLIRGAITGVGVAAATNQSWTRPVINTVVIPAHAGLTGTTTCPASSTCLTSTSTEM